MVGIVHKSAKTMKEVRSLNPSLEIQLENYSNHHLTELGDLMDKYQETRDGICERLTANQLNSDDKSYLQFVAETQKKEIIKMVLDDRIERDKIIKK